mgnify:CR=1 FL=1
MPTTSVATLKTYFQTLDKPTQEQFYAWLDSFRHGDQKITIDDLSNDLKNFLNGLGSRTFEVLAPGTASYTPSLGTRVEVFVFDDVTNPLVDISLTPNGKEFAEDLQLENGEFTLEKAKRIKTTTTFYFEGISNNTIITIYKR